MRVRWGICVDMRQMYMNAPGIEKQKDGRERKGKERVFATERLMTERDVAVLPFVPSPRENSQIPEINAHYPSFL